MDAPREPNWSLLPRDPAGFFELSAAFDRKDLKRAYNRLLKQFKPEKHPQEFQRIRQAFELLDGRLRYGANVSAPSAEVARYRWSVPEAAVPPPPVSPRAAPEASAPPPAADGSRGAAPPAPLPLSQRVVNEAPAELYLELKQTADKRPWHYYALAVLADALPQPDADGFIKWILAGMKAFPYDPALYQLLYAYLRGPIPDKDIPRLLGAVSRIVKDDGFYVLTEPLWDQLLRVAPFSDVAQLLAKCESQLADFRILGKLTFAIHLLKSAVWTADRDWIDRTFAFLDSHFQEIPPSLENDVEFLHQLRAYLAMRERFVDGNPLRALLDQTIRSHCTAPPLEAERAFVQTQVRLATAGEELLAAFPAGEDADDLSPFLMVWHFLNAEYGDRAADQAEEVEGVELMPFLRELDALTSRNWLGWSWGAAAVAYRIGCWAVYPATYFAITLSVSLVAAWFRMPLHYSVVIGLLVLCIVLGYLFNRYASAALWRKWCFRRARHCYEQIWRPEIHQFLGRTYMPFFKLLTVLDIVRKSRDSTEYGVWILISAQGDAALFLYSGAQRYLA